MRKLLKRIIMAIVIISFTLAVIFTSLSFVSYKTNTYKITNGTKEIVFQEMIHIGDSEYYNSVNKDIDSYKNNGYVYMYEMIKIEDDSDKKEMIDLLGLSPEIFKNIADSTKLDSQHNHMMLVDNNSINADITARELVSNFKKGNIEKNEFMLKSNEVVNSIFKNINMNNKVSTIVSRNLMKLGLFVNDSLDIHPNDFSDVIIKQRNDTLIKFIDDSKNNKIYVQYGKLHFKDFSEKMIAKGYKIETIETKEAFK